MIKLVILNIVLTFILFVIYPTNAIGQDEIIVHAPTQITQHYVATNLNNNTIRIGLESRYLNAQQVNINNNTLIVGNYDNGFSPLANINGNNFSVVVDDRYYVNTGNSFYNFISAYTASSSFYNSVVSIYDGGFAIFIGPFNSYYTALISQNIYGGSIVSASNSRVRLMDGYRNVITKDSPLFFVDGDYDFMQIGGRSYRGIIEIGRNTNYGITPVNIINIEEYLFSVVPSEMPASWHIEALKAQAVAARSYTHSRRGSHNHLGYELCDTIFSQVYTGVTSEHPNSTLAVQLTSGLMAYFNDTVILAVYFSSSGGVTENSENAWIEAVPYLRSVQDTYEAGAMEWDRTFTLTEINNFARNRNINIGNMQSISIVHFEHGRVANLILNGTNGTYTLRGENIRTFFGPHFYGSLHSRNFNMVGAESTTYIMQNTVSTTQLFYDNIVATNYSDIVQNVPQYFYGINYLGNVSNLNESIAIAGQPNTLNQQAYLPATITQSQGYNIHFMGRGWGHGVGMSQFGANSMANLDFNYRQILKHYFTGIEIR